MLAGLDIGTSKTAIVVATAVSGALKVLGAASCPSVGLQKGTIADVGSTAKSIKQTLEKVEKLAGARVRSAYVGFNGTSVSLKACRTNGAGLIEGLPQDEEVLQFIPAHHATGGYNVYSYSGKLAITAKADDIASIMESVRLAGLLARDVIYSPLAGAEALLSPAEMELGVVLVEIGASTTTVSVFDRGAIRGTAVLSIGGEHLAGDLAIGLRTSMGKAEEILKKVSLETGLLEISAHADKENNYNPKCLISPIVGARVMEILDFVAEAVAGFNYPGLLPAGVVLYGGVSRLDGLVPLAERRWQRPVKTSLPGTTGMPLNLDCTNAYGLVKYGLKNTYKMRGRYLKKRCGNNSFMRSFIKWFQEKQEMK